MSFDVTVRVTPALAEASPLLTAEPPTLPDALKASIQRQASGLRRRLQARGVHHGAVQVELDGDDSDVEVQLRLVMDEQKLAAEAHGAEPEEVVRDAFGVMQKRLASRTMRRRARDELS